MAIRHTDHSFHAFCRAISVIDYTFVKCENSLHVSLFFSPQVFLRSYNTKFLSVIFDGKFVAHIKMMNELTCLLFAIANESICMDLIKVKLMRCIVVDSI